MDETVTHFAILVPGTGPHREDEKPKGTFMKKAKKFREMLRETCRREFADTNACVEMVPIEFHADMHSLGTTNERMDKVTLPSIPWIRTLDNEVIGDIMYYFSTFHGRQMLEMVTNKLNSAHSAFIEAHPGFNGQIDLIAHSLGGLICYELLYLMDRRRSAAQPGGLEEERYRGLPSLHFTPNRLFTMGAPLGGTMVFRNLVFGDYVMGPVGYHNIFHPYDPFGYRTEPLADAAFADTPAVPITGVPAEEPSAVGKPRRLSMGRVGSMVDLGRTFVDAMAVAPVAISSTVLRAARTTASLPKSVAHRVGSAKQKSSTSEKGPLRRRMSELLGVSESKSTSWVAPAEARRRHSRRSLSRLLLRRQPSTHSASKPLDPEEAMAAQPSKQQQGSLSSTDKPDAERSSDSSSTLSGSCTPHLAATLNAMAASEDTPLAADAHKLESYSMGGYGDVEADSMVGQIMQIFALSRPPDKVQQLAEAQGLPLSSRIVSQHVPIRPTLTTPPQPTAEQPQKPEPLQKPEPPKPSPLPLRRANTLPLAVADGRHRLRASKRHKHSADSAVLEPRERSRLPYSERMDYIIPFTKRHLQNEYWLGFQAHFSYWTSKEVVHHILYHMVRKPI
ncbi:DDHD domain-containing protein [Coemansia spiralis]|nr:DDHD domain-containing protein [Coemansia spiralis]